MQSNHSQKGSKRRQLQVSPKKPKKALNTKPPSLQKQSSILNFYKKSSEASPSREQRIYVISDTEENDFIESIKTIEQNQEEKKTDDVMSDAGKLGVRINDESLFLKEDDSDGELPQNLIKTENNSIIKFVTNPTSSPSPDSIIKLETQSMQGISLSTDLLTNSNTSYEVEDNLTDISCPICLLSLVHLDLRERESHVNQCLLDPDSSTCKKPMIYKSMKQQQETSFTDFSFKSRYLTEMPSSIENKNIKLSKSKSINDSKPKRPKRPIPDLKILRFPNDLLAVDAFCYAADDKIDNYLLTHFHADHYGGLCKSWDRGKRIIVTKITANMLLFKMKIGAERLMVIENYDVDYDIPNTNLKIRCFDGNHCPGSGIFVIECKITGVRFLHCGDFRINKNMIKQLIKFQPFNKIYLDTTYLKPRFNFPRQEVLIDETCKYLSEKSKSYKINQSRVIDFFGSRRNSSSVNEFLITIGTYVIGKERIAIQLAKTLGTKIYCDQQKATTLKLLQWDVLDELIDTENPHKCKIHLISIRNMNKEYLTEYLKKYSASFKSIIGLAPTGWSFKYTNPIEDLHDMIRYDEDAQIVRDMISSQFERTLQKDKGKGFFLSRVINLPYSEHSSFRELFYFVNILQFGEIIPTVNMENNEENFQWLNKFDSFAKLEIEDL